MRKDTVPLERARARLAIVWFSGSGVSFVLLVVQSIIGVYKDEVQEVWAWFAPLVFPTLALMTGVVGATALQSRTDERRVKGFFLSLSVWLSVVYLVLLLAVLLLWPFSTMERLSLFIMSNYFLTPVQALVVAAMAVLFTSAEKST